MQSSNPNIGIDTPAFDAFLLVSFGGPEQMDDVMPFLENVLRGKNVPHERMVEVAHHYEQFGGVSPINEQNRELLDALRAEFRDRNLKLPIYWGNRNWNPLLADTLRQMRDDGIKHALAFFTSAYSSYSGCRQYREDIARAQAEVGEGAPQVSLIRKFYNHPGFILPNAENVRLALEEIAPERRAAAQVAFTAHSIPMGMANNSQYVAQLNDACALVATEVGSPPWKLVFQSRSGPPSQPWLAPDIGEHLRDLHAAGVTDVVVAPIGFISDHLEVLFDLDTEAQQLAAELGMTMIRAATAGTHPAFVSMIYELVVERIKGSANKRAMGERGPSHDVCPVDCCLPGVGRPAPAAAGAMS